MFDTSNSENILKTLIDEYDFRKVLKNSRDVIGSLRYDTKENCLYVCQGRINGEYIWRKLEDQESTSK